MDRGAKGEKIRSDRMLELNRLCNSFALKDYKCNVVKIHFSLRPNQVNLLLMVI